MSIYKGTLSVLNTSKKTIDTKIRLNCGIDMPILGFGTFTIRGTDLIYRVLDVALKAGYRSFDTAAVYGNEKDVGSALKKLLPKYNLKREDIFITSKLAPKDQGKDKVQKAIAKSLSDLDLDYLDLYLIHWPGAEGILSDSNLNSQLRAESWSGMTKEYEAGKLKAIGVSNYTARHMSELPSSMPPAVNQVEFHPYYEHPNELYRICAEYNTLLQAYSSLGGNPRGDLVSDHTVVTIAKKLNQQPAQILLRWCLQRGYAVIPKSVTPERIVMNTQLDFELPDEEMKALNSLGKKQKLSWDPELVA